MPYHKLCNIEDVDEGKGRKFVVEGKNIGLFKVEGKYYAIDDDCTHEGASLSDGIMNGKCVTCPLHAWKFDVTNGKCDVFDSAPDAKTYDVVTESGEILVYIE
jgi:nitrite reductase/ring-hydroxylating ferredoxin subunit